MVFLIPLVFQIPVVFQKATYYHMFIFQLISETIKLISFPIILKNQIFSFIRKANGKYPYIDSLTFLLFRPGVIAWSIAMPLGM